MFNLKSQGMPIQMIAIIMLGIIVLALILLYVFGVFGEGGGYLSGIFSAGENITENATQSVESLR